MSRARAPPTLEFDFWPIVLRYRDWKEEERTVEWRARMPSGDNQAADETIEFDVSKMELDTTKPLPAPTTRFPWEIEPWSRARNVNAFFRRLKQGPPEPLAAR